MVICSEYDTQSNVSDIVERAYKELQYLTRRFNKSMAILPQQYRTSSRFILEERASYAIDIFSIQTYTRVRGDAKEWCSDIRTYIKLGR